LGLNLERITLIDLHGGKDYYKQGPNREEKGADIHRIPTFIFEKDLVEIGRIVKRPLIL